MDDRCGALLTPPWPPAWGLFVSFSSLLQFLSLGLLLGFKVGHMPLSPMDKSEKHYEQIILYLQGCAASSQKVMMDGQGYFNFG